MTARRYDSRSMKRWGIFATILAIMALALSHGAAQTVSQEELLWWLPADTQSVVAARGPFRFPVPVKDDKEERNWQTRKASPAEIFQEFEQQPLELVYSRSPDLITPLQGMTVAFAMQGSRRFRDPLPGFEVMDFEGCSIVVLENDLKDTVIPALARQATSTETLAGTKVLVFHEKDRAAEWDDFVAAPRPNVLLVANNRSYLQEVLERIGQQKQPRALPVQQPEWRFLNPDARFWGLRHYDRTQAKGDPTSPFNPADGENPIPLSKNNAFDSGDQKAIGLLYALDPANPHKAVITYFSGDEARIRDAASVGTYAAEPQQGVRFRVKIQNPMPGVLEQVFTLDRTDVLGYFIMIEEVAFGRGMWI